MGTLKIKEIWEISPRYGKYFPYDFPENSHIFPARKGGGKDRKMRGGRARGAGEGRGGARRERERERGKGKGEKEVSEAHCVLTPIWSENKAYETLTTLLDCAV